MADNNIRNMRIKHNLSQGDLADNLPDGVNRVIVSFIEAGRALPNAESMKALCDLFICSPTDLYDPKDIDLGLSDMFPEKLPPPVRARTSSCGRGAGHQEMTEFRTWVKPEEKQALETAIKKLGYRSSAEWFREAFRALLEKCAQLNLQAGKTTITDIAAQNAD